MWLAYRWPVLQVRCYAAERGGQPLAPPATPSYFLTQGPQSIKLLVVKPCTANCFPCEHTDDTCRIQRRAGTHQTMPAVSGRHGTEFERVVQKCRVRRRQKGRGRNGRLLQQYL